ncbi:MAG: hypothetical protein IKI08_02280 [Selenomonadaceae bacterium]|nr:hypothetical protein [Selenomonadaceae bacterium]
MAIWKIPDEYKIDYSRNGDDVDAFSRKVKYCLEEAFVGLNELHEATKGINSSIASLTSAVAKAGTSSVAAALSPLTFVDGDKLLGEYNGSSTLKIDFQTLKNQSGDVKDLWHLTRLVENLYLVLDVAGLNPGGYDGLSSEAFYGTTNDIDASRSTGTVSEGEISGDGAIFITKPIAFINQTNGAATPIKDAHLVVKHRNVADAEITAELALCDATFINDEVLGIGNGLEQTVSLEHKEKLTAYNFAIYFDGVKQSGNFFLDTEAGEVTFIAPVDVIVTADYFYNWGEENFVAMEKTGTYPDHKNPNRATTQFICDGGAGGTVATLRLTLKQSEGYSQNEIVTTGTGKPQGFKLKHQAIADAIQVIPSSTTWTYSAAQNVIVINAPSGQSVSVSYWWKGKSFSVDSFAILFNE